MQLEVSVAENELQKIDALCLKLQLPQGSAARRGLRLQWDQL